MGLSLLRNRAILGAVALLVLLGCWEFKWKPQYRPLYEAGRASYQRGDYAQALPSLDAAYSIEPNASELVTLLGWTHLKLHQPAKARYYFQRALKIEPDDEDAQLGIAALDLDEGRSVNIDQLKGMLRKRPGDPDVMSLLAAVYVQEGKNSNAANLFRRLLRDKNYNRNAHQALEELFGLQGFSDPIPVALAPLARPEMLKAPFRAAEGSMWRLEAGIWQKYYVAGVDFGPAVPGYSAGEPPFDGKIYSTYLQAVRRMNANVIRTYTLLPPSFYRAFSHAAKAGARLLLYQQIWIGDPPGKDLFNSGFVDECRAEIRYVVDALHGRGDVPKKPARGGGLYSDDIAGSVGAILFGREIEPSTVIQTNLKHTDKSSYYGEYMVIENGTATEVWFAQMLDYVVAYESSVYNWQHPVALVNWPPLDPLTHPTESTFREEMKYRVAAGENLGIPRDPQDDEDSVSIDEAKFKQLPSFQAGLFASYHVYPYYPDFLVNDPGYLATNDRLGSNPFAGYLRELRAHIPFPLVISEYGIPTSIGVSHLHPLGWNHGGHSEGQQAGLLVRFTHTIRDVDCAGGIVFELVDEWYKHNWLTVDFEKPLERANLWLNELDPEKRFGLIGFHSGKWKLFADVPGAWENEATLYEADGMKFQAAWDEAFVYLRLSGVCAECVIPTQKTTGNGSVYAIAIQTLPNTGAQKLPFGNVTIDGGANFLLVLDSLPSARLLVADNYSPYRVLPDSAGGESRIAYRHAYVPTLLSPGLFTDLVVETNRQRFARDGRSFPAQRFSWSRLRFGNGNPEAGTFDSLAEWSADAAKGTILVRLAWGKLLVTDPSSRQVFFGLDALAHARSRTSPGIGLAFFTLQPGTSSDLSSMNLLASVPKAENGKIQNPVMLVWRPWNAVNPQMYLKKSYYALQKEFSETAGNYDMAAENAADSAVLAH